MPWAWSLPLLSSQAHAPQKEVLCYVRNRMELCSPDLEEVGRIVRDGLKGHRVRVYLFGSWVRDRAGRTSDIDVAVLPLEPLPAGLLSEIREALEESRVIYPVDLVDLSESTPQFRERVLREGVLWNG